MQNKLLHIEDLSSLFFDVQEQQIFPDQKLFTDCLPKFDVQEIVAQYYALKQTPGFDMVSFLKDNFHLPANISTPSIHQSASATAHILKLWPLLTKSTKNEYGTLIHLPYPFIVPGGRFRELFYWDSYFTMLGLSAINADHLVVNMVDNFAYMIENFGFIPNANRSYFLSRSQPPFFSLMVNLLAKKRSEWVLIKYLPQLKKEYAFWMQDEELLNSQLTATKHVVLMPDGSVLNRYWDKLDTPRPEGHVEDLAIYNHSKNKNNLYRNIRAACESGWDFSSRWFTNPEDITTIKTTAIIPVDLNCLLWNLENTLATILKLAGDDTNADKFAARAKSRHLAIDKYLWNEQKEQYADYDVEQASSTPSLNLAMVYPLFFNLATKAQAATAATCLRTTFLKPGGLVTTPIITGQQWDAPNGWAPLNWMAYQAVKNYGYYNLATEIAQNWIATVDRAFANTGKIMEKYNVVDVSLTAGGGEYPNQDGFGWTNGVYLKFKQELHQLNLK